MTTLDDLRSHAPTRNWAMRALRPVEREGLGAVVLPAAVVMVGALLLPRLGAHG